STAITQKRMTTSPQKLHSLCWKPTARRLRQSAPLPTNNWTAPRRCRSTATLRSHASFSWRIIRCVTVTTILLESKRRLAGNKRLPKLRAICMRRALALLILAAPLPAQEALTLRQAVDLALRSNPLVAAVDAGEKEAEARIHQARSGYLPRLQFSESL